MSIIRRMVALVAAASAIAIAMSAFGHSRFSCTALRFIPIRGWAQGGANQWRQTLESAPKVDAVRAQRPLSQK